MARCTIGITGRIVKGSNNARCEPSIQNFNRFGSNISSYSGTSFFSLRFAETPYLSLLPDITPQSQRSTASGTMNFFGSMGLISYFVISSQIWDSNPTAVFYIVAFVAFVFVLITITLLNPVFEREKELWFTGTSRLIALCRSRLNQA